jgi:hypothetical protein
MSLSKVFPVNIVSQIFENELYSVQEISRDKRKIDYESYFTKGTRVSRLIEEISTKSDLLKQIWDSFLETSLLFTKYIHEMEYNNFFISQLDLLYTFNFF